MIPYLTDAGRIKQRILCCRKFIIIFGSSDLFIEQLLALAACRLLKFSFMAWQKFYILSLLSLGRFSKGILINISSKKNAFVRVFTLTIRHFETGLDEGKIRWCQSNFDRRVWAENFVQHLETCLPISITETDRVLWLHLVMLITIFFRWMYKMKYSCYQDYSIIHGWFLFQVFGWELHAPLDQVIGNPTSDGIVFVFNLALMLKRV